MKQRLSLLLFFHLACASPKPADPDIWRPPLGQGSGDKIPGPLKRFGPFDSPGKALEAACPLILSKPNASAAHLRGTDPRLAIRLSTEYCAWLYYTPEHKYELSLLTDQANPGADLSGKTSCTLPASVDDPRYPPSSLQHIYCIHNHPFSGEITREDIYFAAAMANAHGLVAKTQGRQVPLAVIAFISNSQDPSNPTCDGFYQYIPATRELMKWTRSSGAWRKDRYATVIWTSPTDFIIQRE